MLTNRQEISKDNKSNKIPFIIDEQYATKIKDCLSKQINCQYSFDESVMLKASIFWNTPSNLTLTSNENIIFTPDSYIKNSNNGSSA